MKITEIVNNILFLKWCFRLFNTKIFKGWCSPHCAGSVVKSRPTDWLQNGMETKWILLKFYSFAAATVVNCMQLAFEKEHW